MGKNLFNGDCNEQYGSIYLKFKKVDLKYYHHIKFNMVITWEDGDFTNLIGVLSFIIYVCVKSPRCTS